MQSQVKEVVQILLNEQEQEQELEKKKRQAVHLDAEWRIKLWIDGIEPVADACVLSDLRETSCRGQVEDELDNLEVSISETKATREQINLRHQIRQERHIILPRLGIYIK